MAKKKAEEFSAVPLASFLRGIPKEEKVRKEKSELGVFIIAGIILGVAIYLSKRGL